MTTQNYKSHIISLAALFTLANTIILTPPLNLANMILLSLFSFAVLLLFCFLQNCRNKILYLCGNVLAYIAAIYGAVISLSDYLQFLKSQQMPNTNMLLLSAGFVAVIIIFILSKTYAIYKYCLFVFVIIIAVLLLCFLSGIKNFDYKNLSTSFLNFHFSAKQCFRLCLPLATLTFFNYGENATKKPIIYGVLTGLAMLFIVMFQSTITLGSVTGEKYLYLKAVSTVSVGSLFTRLDGLVWFLFFATSLIKIVVCIKAIIFTNKKYRDIIKQKSKT